MPTALPFDRSFTGIAGEVTWLSPRVRRVLANNPSALCFTGTNTYIVGTGNVAIIDPGPDDDAHYHALHQALRGERVTHILLTHRHKDHAGLARRFKGWTGAPLCAAAWTKQADVPAASHEAFDAELSVDLAVQEGMLITGPGWSLHALETPGHTADHMCFALEEDRALFTGDHVMAWSTSFIAPPDGDMRAYRAALARLRDGNWTQLWPGHGNGIADPHPLIEAYCQHREERAAQILDVLKARPHTADDIAAQLYTALSPALLHAATLTVLAHLHEEEQAGRVRCEGERTAPTALWSRAFLM